jgi:hypothetical protein
METFVTVIIGIVIWVITFVTISGIFTGFGFLTNALLSFVISVAILAAIDHYIG